MAELQAPERRTNGREKTSTRMKRQREQRAGVKQALLRMGGERARRLQLQEQDLFYALVSFLDGPELDRLREEIAKVRAKEAGRG